jgi:S-adenosylmethionine/arginine decarboxylase-like enzyme
MIHDQRSVRKTTRRSTKAPDESTSEGIRSSQRFSNQRFVRFSLAHSIPIMFFCGISAFYLGQRIQKLVIRRRWKQEEMISLGVEVIDVLKPDAISEERRNAATISNDFGSMLKDLNFMTPHSEMGWQGLQHDNSSFHNIIRTSRLAHFWGYATFRENTTFSIGNKTEEILTDEVLAPCFQQLVVELEHVRKVFLDSRELLEISMVELAQQLNLSLLTYHCQASIPSNEVSCFGVLTKGHISVQTWPQRGLLHVHIFAPGVYSLMGAVSEVIEIFGIPDNTVSRTASHVVWNHKRKRVYEFQHCDVNSEESDFELMLGTSSIVKDFIATVRTDFQRIDFYNILESSYRSIGDKDRFIYMDGVLQSKRNGEAAHHEALVHPAMFAHEMPKRVAIIGGGEGATLREVLKHKLVENVVMIEIDEIMVKVLRQYLPEWSDCSDLRSIESNCFDDPRVEVVYADAIQWFINAFGINSEPRHSEPFDVIIMDSL